MTFSSAPPQSDTDMNRQGDAIRRRLNELEKQLEDFRWLISQSGDSGSAPLTPDEAERLAQVREVLQLRRARTRYFKSQLFGEPAWDMLLELYAANLTQRRMSISSLCESSGTPATTALRWLTTLEQEGLLQRRADPLDRRRVFVELTEAGSKALGAYFHNVRGG